MVKRERLRERGAVFATEEVFLICRRLVAASILAMSLWSCTQSASPSHSEADDRDLDQFLTIDQYNEVICSSVAKRDCPTGEEEMSRADFAVAAGPHAQSLRKVYSVPDEVGSICMPENYFKILRAVVQNEIKRLQLNCAAPQLTLRLYSGARQVLPATLHTFVYTGEPFPSLSKPGAERIRGAIGSSIGMHVWLDVAAEPEARGKILGALCEVKTEREPTAIELKSYFKACLAAARGYPCSVACNDAGRDRHLLDYLNRRAANG